MAGTQIQIHRHPSERRQRGSVVLCSPGCCCCCLHAVGSIVGALCASDLSIQAQPPGTPPGEALEKFRPSSQAPLSDRVNEVPNAAIASPDLGLTEAKPPAVTLPSALLPLPDLVDLTDRRLSAAGVYWLTLLALTILACLVTVVHSLITAEGILFLLLLFLPALQLSASLLSALLVFLWPAEEWPARWRTNGRIARWSFIGTIVGVLLMCLGILPFLHW